MNKLVLAAVAATTFALGLGAPAAHADGGSTHVGGCGLVDPGGHPTLYSDVVVYSTVATDNPVSATVTCDYRIDGNVYASATFSGTVVVVGEYDFDVTNYPGRVSICTTVDYTSNGDPSVTTCSDATDLNDVIDDLFDTADSVFAQLESVLCLGLATASPGVPGIVDIDRTGDTYVLDELVYDCPPYLTS